MKELDGWRMIEGQCKNKVLICLCEKSGIYKIFIFFLDDNYQIKSSNSFETQDTNLNCSIKSNGVLVFDNDGHLNVMSEKGTKKFKTPFNLDETIICIDNDTLAIQAGTVFKITLKTK
jgi:hypothetical protein